MNNKLVWIDLETTGLDGDNQMEGCRKHKILEVGLHITDEYFNILDEGLKIVIFHPIEYVLELMDDYVLNMHTSNGLLYDIQESAITTSAADSLICAYLTEHGVKPGSSPICGNSVRLDRNFIDAQMPMLAKFLHYRLIDVSSFKEVYKRILPDVYRKADALKLAPSSHRGLDDIKFSIAEMSIYRDHMLSLSQ